MQCDLEHCYQVPIEEVRGASILLSEPEHPGYQFSMLSAILVGRPIMSPQVSTFKKYGSLFGDDVIALKSSEKKRKKLEKRKKFKIVVDYFHFLPYFINVTLLDIALLCSWDAWIAKIS